MASEATANVCGCFMLVVQIMQSDVGSTEELALDLAATWALWWYPGMARPLRVRTQDASYLLLLLLLVRSQLLARRKCVTQSWSVIPDIFVLQCHQRPLS